jgi:diacylglycerol kinase (ATP)
MSLEHVAVLVNPVAGAGRGLTVGRRAAQRLRSVGVEVDLLVGGDARESSVLAAEAVAAGTDAIIACGGDGLVHLAIQELAGTKTALGVIACGTGNDFARSVGLPRKALEPALAVILRGEQQPVDLGRAGTTWFGAVLATGFDSRVNDRGNRMRWPRGRMKYNVAMVAELTSFSPIDYRLVLDGRELQMPAMMVAVGNGASYGGGMRIWPGASMTDGLLEITVIAEMSRLKLARLFPSVYSGHHVRHAEVLTFRAAHLGIWADDVTAYADGEPVGALPLDCAAVPGALRVLAPGSSGSQ